MPSTVLTNAAMGNEGLVLYLATTTTVMETSVQSGHIPKTASGADSHVALRTEKEVGMYL